jgi:hypothetical protein
MLWLRAMLAKCLGIVNDSLKSRDRMYMRFGVHQHYRSGVRDPRS